MEAECHRNIEVIWLLRTLKPPAYAAGVGAGKIGAGDQRLGLPGAPPISGDGVVAAPRPAYAPEDLGVNQPLEQRVQVAWGQFMTCSQSFGRNRSRPGV